ELLCGRCDRVPLEAVRSEPIGARGVYVRTPGGGPRSIRTAAKHPERAPSPRQEFPMSSERPSKILVRVGKAAFIKERETLYADFESAMARELAQNSLDAGARNIIARTCANEDGTITLTYEDDGQGMSRE